MAAAGEQVEVDVLVAPGNRWQPDNARAILGQYLQGQTPQQIFNTIVDAYGQAEQGWEQGQELIITVPGVPFSISFGTNPLRIGENVYTWLWVPRSMADDTLVFDPMERIEAGTDFARELEQGVPGPVEVAGEPPEASVDDNPLLREARELLYGVDDEGNIRVPRQDTTDINPATGRRYAKGKLRGQAKLRNGVMFKPKRRFYGE